MTFIKSQISLLSEDYKQNYIHNKDICSKLNKLQESIRLGGGEKARVS